ncbi:MAG TPA: M14 family metallopeptidase [Actinomycetota bacterium]
MPAMPADGRRITRRELFRRAGLTAGGIAASQLPLGAWPAGAAERWPTLQLARVWLTNDTAHLVGDFDETHTLYPDGLELLLWPGDRARLDATGLRYEITVPDLIARDLAEEERLAGFRPDLPPVPGERTAYRTLAEMNADLDDLAARFPDTARVFELPYKSHEGRTVRGIEIARDVARSDGRPVLYMDGIHHSREWPAAEMPIMFAFDLLESDGTDPRITNIVDNVRTIIVPIMNPDGFHFSRSALIDVSGVGHPAIGNAYWRKNRRNDGHALDALIPGYGAHGVDPNRNYSYGWGGDGSSASTSSDTYRGPSPLSEPENRNVAHILRTHHVAAMITHHTSGRLVLWAWSWTLNDLHDQQLIEGMGRAMASYNGYTPQKSRQLYIHTGVCVDHAYGAYGTISYTFEHTTAFHPSYQSTIPQMYVDNRPAFLLLAEEGCLPPEQRPEGRTLPPHLAQFGLEGKLHHGILRGRLVDEAGAAVAGTVHLGQDFESIMWLNGNGANPTGLPSVPESVDTAIETEADGTFAWHVNPSSRPYMLERGEQAPYRLTATAGQLSATRDVFIGRGEILDLGDVTVGAG